MQKDMHYDCNYVLARLAGLPVDIAKAIANSGQFVDDNVCEESTPIKPQSDVLALSDRSRIRRVATAHHPLDIENVNLEDQVRVWVPFHFYPGGMGDSLEQKLICTTNSKNINLAIDNHLDMAFRSFSPHLMGITAHVYGDTFSHYGFNGISSKINRIDPDKIMIRNAKPIDDNWEGKGEEGRTEKLLSKQEKSRQAAERKAKDIIDMAKKEGLNFVANISNDEIASLGHAFADTYPDKPYMHWIIEWSYPDLRTEEDLKLIDRNNPKTFLEATGHIHDMFCRYRTALKQAEQQNKLQGWGKTKLELDESQDLTEEMKEKISEVLKAPGDVDFRCAKWNELAKDLLKGESIPEYEGLDWNTDWSELEKIKDTATVEDLRGKNFWQFYRAASVHRNFTLRVLLPEQDIVLR